MTFDDNEFLTSFKNIYSKELDLKVERQGNHVSYLDLDIKVEESVFVHKPFDKRDKFSLFIVRIPHLSSNIQSTISSGSIFSELFWIARCPLRTYDFIPWASDLLSKMIASGGNRAALTKQLRKTFLHYQNIFQKFGITHKEINIRIM